jgi:mannose-6-phosphate isomerase
MTDLQPLFFTPILKDKVWGGDRLAAFGKPVSPGQTIGESWELADLDATSASGGGGGSALSIVSRGPHAGRTLRQLTASLGSRICGRSKLGHAGAFPLLVKFLDARENLSVQVHPSPAYAASHPDAHLKTESWFILDAAPGAVIYKGVKPGVTRDAFAAHIRDNTVVNDMIAIPAIAGECHNLPSGTCHALGAGVLVAEIQTPSDTTFRVYDWGRAGRELHIQQALQCIDFGPAPAATRRPAQDTRFRHVATEFFTIDELVTTDARTERIASDPERATVATVLGGEGEILATAGRWPTRLGDTFLIPAGIAADCSIVAHKQMRLLVATVS